MKYRILLIFVFFLTSCVSSTYQSTQEIIEKTRKKKKRSFFEDRLEALRKSAEKSQIFVILPDGQSRSLKGGIWLFGKEFIAPGSTIVIPRQTKPFDWLVLSESIAPIFANLATSAAAIKVLGDD